MNIFPLLPWDLAKDFIDTPEGYEINLFDYPDSRDIPTKGTCFDLSGLKQIKWRIIINI